MAAYDRPAAERPLAEPSEFTDFLRSRPIVCSPSDGWEGVVLQRFRDMPPVIDVPAMRTEVLVCHLAGPFLEEAGVGSRGYERKWVRAGDVGVNPAGNPVRREIKGKPDVVLVHVPPAKLRAVAEGMFEVDPARVDLVPLLAAPDNTAQALIGLLLAEAVSPAPGSPLMVQSLTHALMIHMLRHHSNLVVRGTEQCEGLPSGRVRRVVDHMRAHLDQPLSLADLAQTGGMSPSRFSRAFHEAIGQPPHRFLVGLRIERACQLLENSDLPIIEVGLRCGFDQPSHFTTVFRRMTGMTPGTWRRERRT